MTLIFQHQEGQRQTEQEFMKTQQLELHEAQQEAVELNTQRQTYQSVLNRLPRLTSTTEVIPFFTGFKQMLIDNEVSETKWLQALQSCIDRQLNMEYWNTFTPQQRQSYPVAKQTLMAWLAFSETACLQRYSITRMKWTESIQQAIHESTLHVDSLLGDTPPEYHRFQWIKARTLAKPKNPVELAQAVNKWEETYGQAAKTWNMGYHSNNSKTSGNHHPTKTTTVEDANAITAEKLET